jgi:phosphatidylserine synthase
VVLSGVVRLSRFKAKDPFRGQHGFSGLPITANAAWVAMFVFVSQTEPYDRFNLNQGPVAALFLLGIVAFILLQVSMVHYPKPTKHLGLFVPMIVMVGLLFAPLQWWRMSVRAAEIMLVLIMVYVVLGPVYAHRKSRRQALAGRPEAGAAHG